MKPVAQTLLKPPDGDCFAACVASILELPLATIPNIAPLQGTEDGRDEGWQIIQRYLAGFGLALNHIDQDQFSGLPEWNSRPYIPGWWIATHELDGVGHATVWENDVMVWNPFPGRHDDVELGELVMAEWFVALDPAKVVRDLGEAQAMAAQLSEACA